MTEEIEGVRDIRAFWNGRSGLGQWAGTRDVTAKQLEMEAIAAFVQDGIRILDLGCGNGITAIELARRHKVDVLGIDFAEEMVAAAVGLAKGQELKGSVNFRTGNVEDLASLGEFDLIYTERVLINLPDWPTQLKALTNIVGLLSDKGIYVMCENSQDGLDKINLLRGEVGLPSILAPWHNRYLRDSELQEVSFDNVHLEDIIYYSSTYYFISRVVNAWLASQEGVEPDYDAPINQLALRLPSIGDLGQGRIWVWRKRENSIE